jgi:hypothetical protein
MVHEYASPAPVQCSKNQQRHSRLLPPAFYLVLKAEALS